MASMLTSNSKKMLRRSFTTACTFALVLTSQLLYAQQGNGNAGIQAATTQVKGYFGTLTTLMYAIGAVVGLIGAIKVYGKWNSGDQDTQKTAVSWFGSMIFLVVVATIIKGFFGV